MEKVLETTDGVIWTVDEHNTYYRNGVEKSGTDEQLLWLMMEDLHEDIDMILFGSEKFMEDLRVELGE